MQKDIQRNTICNQNIYSVKYVYSVHDSGIRARKNYDKKQKFDIIIHKFNQLKNPITNNKY